MLRRTFCGILTVFSVIIFLTSCKNNTSVPTDYQSAVKGASVSFDYGVTSYSADISFDGNIPDDPAKRRAATITFTSPDDLTGLVLQYSEDKTLASIGKVSLDLPENTGNEMYYIVRLFSLYPEEIFEENTGLVKFRADVSGTEVTFELIFDGKFPSSANISWENGQIKISKIAIS